MSTMSTVCQDFLNHNLKAMYRTNNFLHIWTCFLKQKQPTVTAKTTNNGLFSIQMDSNSSIQFIQSANQWFCQICLKQSLSLLYVLAKNMDQHRPANNNSLFSKCVFGLCDLWKDKTNKSTLRDSLFKFLFCLCVHRLQGCGCFAKVEGFSAGVELCTFFLYKYLFSVTQTRKKHIRGGNSFLCLQPPRGAAGLNDQESRKHAALSFTTIASVSRSLPVLNQDLLSSLPPY